jgi:Mg-chelatase subunit ChlD
VEQKLNARVSFIGFRDYNDTERLVVQPFTEDLNIVKDFIKNVKADGGDDIPEDVQGGLKTCVNLDWSKDSIKQVVLITDSVAHGS